MNRSLKSRQGAERTEEGGKECPERHIHSLDQLRTSKNRPFVTPAVSSFGDLWRVLKFHPHVFGDLAAQDRARWSSAHA